MTDKEILEKLKELLKSLTDDDRLELMSEYCYYCGSYIADEKCYCMNDD